MPHKQTFSAPHPILLASILYCSSVRGPPDVAELAPHYFTVLCNAIAHLCIPDSEMGRTPDDTEEWAFQTVLGIIFAGLLNEATVRETGIWISLAYRLILEHSPALDEGSRKWRKLFSGIQILDLEHASLHLSCPVIPIEAPLPGLRTLYRDQLYRLSRMMHTGLTHFAGRGLPTIWSSFTSDVSAVNLTSSFTAVDTAVMRDWARQLDEWLVEFTQSAEGSEQDLKLVFRQYVLHRLVVLSIYHPVRGCNMWSNSITLKEQYELLLSARATLKLHSHDDSIWSNWDQVIITWAALIVIQGIEGGSGEPDGRLSCITSATTNKDRSSKYPSTSSNAQANDRPKAQSAGYPHRPAGIESGYNTGPRACKSAAECLWESRSDGTDGPVVAVVRPVQSAADVFGLDASVSCQGPEHNLRAPSFAYQ